MKNYIVDLLKKILPEHLVYHSGKSYSINKSDVFSTTDAALAKIVVVAKNHYNEWSKKYPIADLSELKKVVLSQKDQSECKFYYFGPVVNQQRSVTCWEIDNRLADLYPKAVLWLPESIIFGSLLEEKDVLTVQSLSGQVFMTKIDGVVRSAMKSSLINSPELYGDSMGFKTKTLTSIVNTPDFILQHIFRTPTSIWPLFFKLSTKVGFLSTLKRVFVSIIAVMLFYNIALSSYLYFYNDYVVNSMQNRSTELDSMLEMQSSLLSYNNLLQTQKTVLQEKQFTYPIWGIVHYLLEQDVTISNFELSSSEWLIRGEAKSATAILESLKQNELVKSAEFDNAVRRNSDMDTFAIRLSLVNGDADGR